MAQYPLIQSNVPIRGQQFPTPGPDYFGRPQAEAADYTAKLYQRIQDGADAAEATKLNSEGPAEMKAALAEAKFTISDPEEYHAFARDKMKEIEEATVSRASNNIVRRSVTAHMAGARASAQDDIITGYFGKKKDKGLQDYILSYEQMTQNAIKTPDLAEQQAMFQGFGILTGQMIRNNYLTAEAGQKFIERFHDKVMGDKMAIHAATDPKGFGIAIDTKDGPYAGADATQIQRSVEIADRTTTHKMNLEKQALNEESKGVEAQMTSKLENPDPNDPNPVTEEKIKAASVLYAWPPDKTQHLMRMLRGLKLDSPYKETLIADAMAPLAKGAISHSDLNLAEQQLREAAGKGQISTKSTEYVQAINQIRRERNNLNISTDIKANQAQRDAHYAYQADRTAASNIFDRIVPGYDAERRKKELGNVLNQLDVNRNNPAARSKILADTEKALTDKKKNRDTWKPAMDGLRQFGK